MGKTLEKLTRAEWQVMNACFRLGKATARQVWEELGGEAERDYQTVKTLLDRIAAKRYLRITKLGPLCLFTPAVPRRKAVGAAIDDFLSTVLDGTVAPLLQHLTGTGRISAEELEALKALVDKRAKEER
jgi:BlaI family transcriptional regulator, penicillinase repressor